MTIGFDNLAINHQLCLSLPFREGVGTLTHDISKNQMEFTLRGGPATWTPLIPGIGVLDFLAANPDWLDCPGADSAALNYTTSDFSLVGWVNLSTLAANRMIFCRGLLDTDGYHWAILMDGSHALYTNQAAANQSSISGVGLITINNWFLLGVSRDGTSVRTFINGQDVTETEGTHIDPVASVREIHIGIYDNETGSPFSNQMWNPRAWSRALTSIDHKYLWYTERDWFEV